jgi:ABC-type multidrug transport system fused ATPase/permease subunit
LQQGLGGVKEVLLLRRSADFLREYQEHNQASARVGRQSTTLQRMPLLLLELLAMSGVAVLVVVLLRDGRSPESIVPVLGLFAAAAFRLLPSVNRLLGAVQGLKFGQPVLELLSRELGLPAQRASSLRIGARLNGDIRFSDVSYLYEGAQSLSIQGVNFSIRRGECVGVVGPSGAGKSTLVDLFLGLLVPTKGSILVGGVPITDALDSWQGGIGYVPQAVFLIDDTLRRNVAFGVPPADVDESRVLGAIEAAQLAPFVASLPLGLDTIVGERGARLSGGQAQRIGIARALYSDPSILVFDEATSSLDADTEAGVMTAIESLRRERTIVIVAHRTATVRRCDFIIRIEGGRVAAMGRPSDVLRADSGVPTTDGSAFSSV